MNTTEMFTTTTRQEDGSQKNVISQGLLSLILLKTMHAVSVTGFIQLPYSSTVINNRQCTSIALNRRNH